jgi:hypothetical protein
MNDQKKDEELVSASIKEPTTAPVGGEEASTAPVDSELAAANQQLPRTLVNSEAPVDTDAPSAHGHDETPAPPAVDELNAAAVENGSPAVAPAASASSPSELFGPPLLVPGENPRNFDDLLERISDAVKPADFIEEIWVRDIVELQWEVLRLRRIKTALLASSAHKGLNSIMFDRWDTNWVKSLTYRWAVRDPKAMKEVDDVLSGAGLGMDAVMAQTLRIEIDTFERLDHMLMKLEARRNSIFREIERHRTVFAQQLRQIVKQVEDAEFKVVEPDSGAGEDAS